MNEIALGRRITMHRLWMQVSLMTVRIWSPVWAVWLQQCQRLPHGYLRHVFGMLSAAVTCQIYHSNIGLVILLDSTAESSPIWFHSQVVRSLMNRPTQAGPAHSMPAETSVAPCLEYYQQQLHAKYIFPI